MKPKHHLNDCECVFCSLPRQAAEGNDLQSRLTTAERENERLKRDVLTPEDFRDLPHTYTLYRDEEGGFVVTVQGRVGCKAHGDTPNQAMLVMIEVQKLWDEAVADGNIPYPSVQTCEICGRPERIAWSIDDSTFERVMGGKDGHTPCLYCFADKAKSGGVGPVIFRVSIDDTLSAPPAAAVEAVEGMRRALEEIRDQFPLDLRDKLRIPEIAVAALAAWKEATRG